MDVDDIRIDGLDHARGDTQQRGVGVGLLERRAGFERVVDAKDFDAVVRFASDAVLRPARIRFPREDRYALPWHQGQSRSQITRVGFRPAR